nr:SP110 nuclear antigen, tandem duplicate 4 isoform X3 [Misgurnus anguillicaudatus]XP_055050566.1 SP110 nuclear antigen, tandem duplicate 4 isoform X3 [Misgurnus anguillicaudatus]XP_055050567.1 SP110 nuclear antigen, tandem duplicate 4 isoform X3 [Misgurnus anguillicaudatus]
MMEEESSLSSESSSESDYSEDEGKKAEQRRKRKMTTQRYSRQSIEKLIEETPLLPVTCGDKEGCLFIEKFYNREKCILSEDQWFKPSEFEKFGGKEKSKKWKTTILCCGVPLQNLIEDKFISCPDFKKSRIQHDESESRERSPVPGRLRKTKRNSSESSRDSGMLRRTKARKKLVSSSSESEERDSVHYENNIDDDDEMNITMFQGPTLPVTCGSVTGILHKKRFAKGYCGKCIRTEDLWLTPEDFLRLGKPDGIWKKDIVVHETTLGKLILRRVLEPDAVSCDCDVCQELNQTNDDDCYVCASEEEVVCCDECPRAFHPHCHLPAAVDIDSGSQWTCTFCMMRKMEESNQRTRQEVLNSPLFQYKLHCQYLLLYLLHEWTAEPCTKVLDSKADDIKLNLQNDNYQTVDEFVTDIERIFQHRTSEGNNDFSRMEHLFKEEFKTIFKLI